MTTDEAMERIKQRREWACRETDAKYYTRGLLLTTLDEADALAAAMQRMRDELDQQNSTTHALNLAEKLRRAEADLADTRIKLSTVSDALGDMLRKASALEEERDAARAEAEEVRPRLGLTIDRLRLDLDAARAEVQRWQDTEASRGHCCWLNEERATKAEASYQEAQITIAGVEAERDHYRRGLTKMTAKRDALFEEATDLKRSILDLSHPNCAMLLRDLESARADVERLREAVRRAVNRICSWGGRGPDDEGVCAACLVWHRAALARLGVE